MDKKYNHKLIEKDQNQFWIDQKVFSTHNHHKKPFTIILPPPNITGKLHLGHAWDAFLQDAIIRYKKLQGFDTFWFPTMDHAGIATQAKIEQKLQAQGILKHKLGQKKFLEYVWQWKHEYAKIIQKQWAKLGLALDYNYQKFTLDQTMSLAVKQAFIKLYHQKLIYRSKSAINWDVKLQTALANIEVVFKQQKSKLYYLKYFFVNSKDYLEVATTRLETLPSDVAVLVNPKDPRYQKYINKQVISPLTKQIIPVIAHSYAKMDFGSGVVKLSMHAKIDIEIIQKLNLKLFNSFGFDGKMTKFVQEFQELDRLVARDKIFTKLNQQNLVLKTEIITNSVGYSQRSNTPIEIMLSKQWFVKMQPLAQKVLTNLNSKTKVKFFPKRFAHDITTWMNKIYDWTISRQLWWGQQIPAWYKNKQIKVQLKSPGRGWKQDQDVLDTWFSSSLAPMTFLGWPNLKNDYLKRYFPSNVLVTGYDIIFFWVARMYFQSLHFMKQIPFENVLIHGLIRDSQGRKMSKSLNNGIDPMQVVEEYGADALRWFLLTNSTPGNDINYSTKKLLAAWNLNNKIWNISRYILQLKALKNPSISEMDTWILAKLANLAKIIVKHMTKYEFTIIAKEINLFITNLFSSWYLEFIKIQPQKHASQLVLSKTLIIISPFLPFIAEAIWQKFKSGSIFKQTWPKINATKMTYLDDVVLIVKAIRQFKEQHHLTNKDHLSFFTTKKLTKKTLGLIKQMTNAEFVYQQHFLWRCGNFYIAISTNKALDYQKFWQNQITKLTLELKRSQKILANPKFINKANQEIVINETKKYYSYLEKFVVAKLENYLLNNQKTIKQIDDLITKTKQKILDATFLEYNYAIFLCKLKKHHQAQKIFNKLAQTKKDFSKLKWFIKLLKKLD